MLIVNDVSTVSVAVVIVLFVNTASVVVDLFITTDRSIVAVRTVIDLFDGSVGPRFSVCISPRVVASVPRPPPLP